MHKKEQTIRLSHKDIIFEDDDFIAVNKKRGWPVHKTLDPKRANLFDALTAFLKNRENGREVYLVLPHRLDVFTSGVVIFGKSERANPVLAKMFKDRTAKKEYCAVCFGAPKEESARLESFLKKERVKRIEKMIPVSKGGQKAITEYRLVDRQSELSLVEFNLITGRMHQIRAHAAEYGFPIVGDDLYGNAADNEKRDLKGQLLHAFRLSFHNPFSKKDVVIEALRPALFGEILEGKTEHRVTSKYQYVIFNKPFDVLCQFTSPNPKEKTLSDYNIPKDLYPVGRLDKDSEGLLLLTNDGNIQNRLANPKHEKEKTYLVQVENIPTKESLKKLEYGVSIQGKRTLPCKAKLMGKDNKIEERNPPVRFRKSIPTCWLEIKIKEGRNRQVRRMTAAIGHPTLRLIRFSIDKVTLGKLAIGEWKELSKI